MSIAGILASGLFSNPLSQLSQHLPAANGAPSTPQSGGATGAQSFFADLQQKLASQSANSAGSTSLSGQMTQLGDDLKSGDIGAAQSDFSTIKTTLAQSATSHLNQLMTVPKAFLGSSSATNTSAAANTGTASSDPLIAAFQAYTSLQQSPLKTGLSNSALNNANSLNINV